MKIVRSIERHLFFIEIFIAIANSISYNKPIIGREVGQRGNFITRNVKIGQGECYGMKKKENNSGQPLRVKKHPFRQKFMAGLLCVCLMLVSLPAELYGSRVLAEGQKKMILSFSPLPENVEQQTVGKGTDLGKVNLPETLEAVCTLLEGGADGTMEGSNKFSDISAAAGKDFTKRAGSEVTPGDSTGTAEEGSAESGADSAETESAREETLAVGPVSWESLPEYDSESEGVYVFRPTLPENYKLSGQAELPKITVKVEEAEKPEGSKRDDGVKKRTEKPDSAKKKIGQKNAAEEPLELLTSEETPQPAAAPACVEITEDTVWGDGELTNGTLTVNSGVTLTINGTVSVTGAVTIQGGGTIARGTESACFKMSSGQELNIYGVTLDGKSIEGVVNFLDMEQGNLLLDQGCVIQNVSYSTEDESLYPSPVYIGPQARGRFGNVTIKNCKGRTGGGVSASGHLIIDGGTYQNNFAGLRGGVISSEDNGTLTINGGEFYGNKASAGGCICSFRNLTINGGNFSGNTSGFTNNEELSLWGGCIYSNGITTINGGTFQNNKSEDCGGAIAVNEYGNLTVNDANFINNTSKSGGAIYIITSNELAVNGGYFEGNTCQEGAGGAIYHGKVSAYNFLLSANVQFFGDGGPYVDSISMQGTDDKIRIDGPILYPLNIFEENSKDGRVVVKGDGSYKLQNKDLKKIHVYNVSNMGIKWYGKLNEEANEIYITGNVTEPGSYNIFYDSNHGQGTAPEDGKDYQMGEDAIIQSGETLSLEGYTFEGWNTKRDGTGTPYQAGAAIKMSGDLTLYAIFKKNADNTAITADFYSGEAGKMQTVTAETGESPDTGIVVAPQLQELPGWTPVGWSASPDVFLGEIPAGSEITVTEDTAYYGIYQKDICLSYQMNGAENGPEPETQVCSANVHQEITYEYPIFTVAFAPERTGYLFQGWNTKEDGSGEIYPAGSSQQLGSSMVLYAIWQKGSGGGPEGRPDQIPEEVTEPVQYTVEHYKQELEGDSYTKEDGDTETLLGAKGAVVEAKAKEYAGFSLNAGHPSGQVSGTAEEGLVLKLYYDRDIYEVSFDLNGGYGPAPETQKVRWGGLLQKVQDPTRAGYHFKGWHLEENGLDHGLWDFGNPVENNTGSLHTALYAMWADETAPVLGEASYSTGHKNFLDWVLQQDSIIINVPVTEEGSGLAKADYVLVSEDETEKEGSAQIEETHGQEGNTMVYGSGGSVIRVLQGAVKTGPYAAIITVDEEFKGKIYLTATDNEGNKSAKKIITSLGGGIIIEDNAPEISFSNTKEKAAGKDIKVNVLVEDAKDGSVSGGLAKVSYQLDEKDETVLPEQDFQKEIVETYKFTVKVSGAGEHILWVNAVDHAGNSNARKVTLNISAEKKDKIEKEDPESPEDTENNGTPFVTEMPGDSGRPGGSGGSGGAEPKTGDSTQIKIYATAAMIAGFSYLLLYFEGEHGITESQKEEIVYHLVSWAKKGGAIRRMLGLAAIFFFLAYYHSIGKSVTVEWREVYKCPR